MDDALFVDALVRQMLEQARRILFGLDVPNADPQQEMPALAKKWASILDARNDDFVQKLTPEAQRTFLKAHGYGSEASDPTAPLLALVTETIARFAEACVAYAEGRIGYEQATFWIETAIEDCSCLMRGLENRAD